MQLLVALTNTGALQKGNGGMPLRGNPSSVAPSNSLSVPHKVCLCLPTGKVLMNLCMFVGSFLAQQKEELLLGFSQKAGP